MPDTKNKNEFQYHGISKHTQKQILTYRIDKRPVKVHTYEGKEQSKDERRNWKQGPVSQASFVVLKNNCITSDLLKNQDQDVRYIRDRISTMHSEGKMYRAIF
jgi:hypothetical protein